MPDYKISLDLPSVSDLERIVNRKIFPLIAQAVRATAQEAQLNWIEAVQHAKLWSGEKAPYIASIKIRYLSDMRAEVVSNYKFAYEIENGRPPRDLKEMLNTSTKVRRTKDGRRFLVIPIRHNTPGNDALAPAMPASVYQLAKEMKPTTVTGQGVRMSGETTHLSPRKGMAPTLHQKPFLSNIATRRAYLVPSNSYSYGAHLRSADLKGESKADQRRYAGMYRMKESTGGSAYLTFRVMMEGSRGWVVKAQPGLYLAKNVAEHLQPIALLAIQEAARREGQG